MVGEWQDLLGRLHRSRICKFHTCSVVGSGNLPWGRDGSLERIRPRKGRAFQGFWEGHPALWWEDIL